MSRPSYDEKQKGAVLVTCATCGKPWWFTDHAETICLACRAGKK